MSDGERKGNQLYCIIDNILGFLWGLACLGTCTYLVVYKGINPWWFAFATFLAAAWVTGKPWDKPSTKDKV